MASGHFLSTLFLIAEALEIPPYKLCNLTIDPLQTAQAAPWGGCFLCPLRTLRLAINCLAVRGVRPRRISSHGRFPPRGPFSILLRQSQSLQPRFASGKTLAAGGGGALHARGRCGIPGHRLRLAMNCFAIRGVRPGLTPRGVPSRRGPPFPVLLRRSQFASTKALLGKPAYAAGRRGASRARGRCRTPAQAQAGVLFRRSRRPARISPTEVPSRGHPHSVEASNPAPGLPPAKRLCAAGGGALAPPVGDASTRSRAQAGNGVSPFAASGPRLRISPREVPSCGGLSILLRRS